MSQHAWRHAWIEPSGVVHPVAEWGHERWALERGATSNKLLRRGWVAVSYGCWEYRWMTQSQFELAVEWHAANGFDWIASKFEVTA